MNVLDLAQQKVKLKKVSSTHGGEWHGPCVSCGGTDRFHVWPEQNEGQGGYWCRGCEKAGDAIQFLRDFEGKSFKEACEFLNLHPDETKHTAPAARRKPEFQPTEHESPVDLWQQSAESFITWTQTELNKNKNVLDWLAARGIDLATAEYYRLGWNPGDDGKDLYRPRKLWGLPEFLKEDRKRKALWLPRGLVIPHAFDGVLYRIRIRRPEGEPRYYVIPGSAMAPMMLEQGRRAFVVVEAELDAIAVVTACGLVGALALGSSAAKPDKFSFDVLRDCLQILNALDYDAAGAKAMKWWDEQFPRNCDRWPVPQGKDPGEAYKMGTDFDLWIKAGLPPALTITSENKEVRMEGERCYSSSLTLQKMTAIVESKGLSPLILELWKLLRSNPGVRIVNTPERLTVLRHEKYVGGRINYLVFREPIVTDYILNNTAEEIGAANLIY